jgi:hypothetical protein
MRTAVVVSLALILALALTACGPRTPEPDRYTVLRTYGWDTTVPDPQAEWNPTSYQVLSRAEGGFVLLDEGSGKQDYFASLENRQIHHPTWLNGTQFVYGPATNVLRADSGAVVPHPDGLHVVRLLNNRPVSNKPLASAGYRPRRWKELVVAQVEDRLQLIDNRGKVREFSTGFAAIPQADGPGICYLETPVFENDLWTAKPKLSSLIIRWKPGKVTVVPGGVDATWTANGGVVVTVLADEPEPGKPWWAKGTELRYFTGPKDPGRLVGTDLHAATAHPVNLTLAAVAADGRLMLVDLPGRPSRVLADHGERPRWSIDGTRLLVEEPLLAPSVDPNARTARSAASAAKGRYLRVYVLSTTTDKR